MSHAVRGPEPGVEVAEVRVPDQVAVLPAAEVDAAGLGEEVFALGKDAPAAQETARVGRDLDPGPDLGYSVFVSHAVTSKETQDYQCSQRSQFVYLVELRGLLKNNNGMAPPCQGNGGGKPAESSSGNDNI